MSFVIFTDDHEPAHVHVFGDGEAKIEIGGDGLSPRMIYAADMKGSTQRRARRAVAAIKHCSWRNGLSFMVEPTDEEIEAANRRGRIEMATKPRARAARYDRDQGRLVVELVNGSTFFLPPELLQGFDRATPDQIAEVEIWGRGFGLHWESLDADFTVEGLMAGRFGTARYMRERFGPEWDAVAAE